MSVSEPLAEAACGNCKKPAGPGMQFCSGCGQPLWQKCPQCRTQALLTQVFCNNCGKNLTVVHEEQQAEYQKIYDHAVRVAGQGKFNDAKRIAGILFQPKDYRYIEFSERAKKFCEEIDAQLNHWEVEFPKIQSRATRYQQEERFKDIVSLLEPIPSGMMPDELKALLAQSKQTVASLKTNKSELKAALAEKRYTDALSCLSQIVQLNPSNTKYKNQLEEVANKVREKATRYGRQGQFAKAVQMLHTLPADFKDEVLQEKLHSFEEAIFLRLILAKNTFFNPIIPSIIDKLDKITPSDELVQSLRTRSQDIRKKSKSYISDQWPEWMKPEGGSLGVPIIPSKIPVEFPGAKTENIANKGSLFWVALGLAMQAINEGMPKGDFLSAKEPNKGIMSVFSKKKQASDVGWGVDIGDSSIKAIRLKRPADSQPLQIENAVIIPLEVNASKSRKWNAEAVTAGLKKLVADHQLGDQPVVVNFAGNECATRFNLLPPSSDKKKFDDFVMQDVRANVPMSLDLLMTAYHICDGGDNDQIVPSSILAAARKPEIETRKSVIEATGINLLGIQPEPFALWNALRAINEIEAKNESVRTTAATEDVRTSMADMVIDVGHNRTNILITHAKGIWYRTLDWGLSDMSQSLCMSQKLTFAEAEKMRRDPLRSEYLQLPIDSMLAACQVPCREIQRSAYAARESIGQLRLSRVRLIGGGAFQPFLSSWLNGCEF